MRQGWHYETADDDAPLEYKGVVFNEMKGYYSTPDILLNVETQRNLLPDTPYANSAGGDPAAMPDLTYEQFKRFHETLYHPSNARIFFYGDDDPEQRLKLIDEFITEFEQKDVDAAIPLQQAFDAPRTTTKPYDSGEFGADSKKAFVTVSWLLPEIHDHKTMLKLRILSQALVGSSASPLRKALIDSGLGEDIVGGGFSGSNRQAMFSTGLKGIAADDAKQVETLILETLGKLADDGLTEETLNAAINKIEFNMRERNTGPYPRGLVTALQVIPTWLHGGNPLDAMEFEDTLAEIKDSYDDNPAYFENLIGEYLLDNPHRSTVILTPDPELGARRDATERERLDKARDSMDSDDIRQIIDMQEELRIEQETPNTPEELATIPTLTLDDIEREITTVPTDMSEAHGATIHHHDLPTSGIAYMDFGFNLKALPAELLPYVGLFSSALTKMGTHKEDFVTLSQRIDSSTGGIGVTDMTSVRRDTRDQYAAYLFVKTKAMLHQTDDVLDILRDILLDVNLDDRERFMQLVLERKARMEAYLNMSGHLIALRRLRAQDNAADRATEQMKGLENLLFVRELVENVQNNWEQVSSSLKRIRDLLIQRRAMVVNATLPDDAWQQVAPRVHAFINDLPGEDVTLHDWQFDVPPANEGLTLPAQVNFVGKGGNLYDLGYDLDGSYVAIKKHLSLTYLWNRIRVQGGAYGGTFLFDSASGSAQFLSWQDPNIVGTLKNYDEAADYLKQLSMTQDELETTIIGAIGDIESHDLPDAKGFKATVRHLIGYTDEMRQQLRDDVLATTLDDFHHMGEMLAKLAENANVVVVGSPDALNAANEELGDILVIRSIN
jgi:hypothetical protein